MTAETTQASVLVVEDEPSVRILLERSLREWGYGVVVAQDGRVALEHLEAQHVDVVLTDIRMPSVSGLEITKWVRDNRPQTDVILMTGYASLETAAAALRLGASDYLLKPFHELNLVRRAVDRALARQQLLVETDGLRKQVERYDRLSVMGELTAGVAHEISGPTMMIMTNSAVARESIERIAEARAALATHAAEDRPLSVEHAARLCKLLDQLEELAIETDSAAQQIMDSAREMQQFARGDDDEHTNVLMNEVVDSAIAIAMPQLRHRANVTTELDEELPALLGSRGRLVQVLVNLLVNAAHALEGVDLEDARIFVTTSSDEREVVCAVRDTGRGIDDELKARMFDAFVTTRESDRGTGLGLTICADIVRRHGGTIEVDSAVGGGATFTLRFPYGEESEPPSEERVETELAARGRVLVVDDESMLLHSIRRMLEATHDVTLVDNAPEALERLKEEPFDVVLCDLVMPGMDGVEFYEKLQQQNAVLAASTVFMTGGAVTDRTQVLADKLRERLLRKPFTKTQLLAAIEEARVE